MSAIAPPLHPLNDEKSFRHLDTMKSMKVRKDFDNILEILQMEGIHLGTGKILLMIILDETHSSVLRRGQVIEFMSRYMSEAQITRSEEDYEDLFVSINN
jgi:hypothetical protein